MSKNPWLLNHLIFILCNFGLVSVDSKQTFIGIQIIITLNRLLNRFYTLSKGEIRSVIPAALLKLKVEVV